jgi:hypothetical protein
MGVSFYAQNQAQWAAGKAANDAFFNNTSTRLFTAGLSSNAPASVMSTPNPYAIIDPFGQATLNEAMNRAILAADAGNKRVQLQTAAAQGNNTTRPAGDLSSQVTFSGSLGANFGPSGPPMGGGYSFVSGSDLKANLQVAFGALTSNSEKIDTVSVVGDTMIGSTSGPNAHAVFTLELHAETGLYTFQLVGPIDQSNQKGASKSIYLQSLFQAKNAAGQKVSLPTIEMDVYNDYGAVQSQGNWAVMHEGSLTYKDPRTINLGSTAAVTAATGGSSGSSGSGTSTTGSTKSAPYKAPTDPRTGYSYTSNPGATSALANTVNIFS